MMTKKEASENAVAGSADEKEAIVESSSTATENQSNASSNPVAADGATAMAPSQGIQHPARAVSEDGDHPPNGQNGRANADTGQPKIEPPDNREKIPENRECKEPAGYGRPPEASRFRPGRSGNPGGRPRKLPISERYLEMSEKRLPEEVRLRIEGKLKMKLRKGITFGDALCQVIWMSALGCFELGRGLMAIKEIREAMEGKATQRTWVPEPPVRRDGDALRRHIMGKLIETAYKRSKLYNIEIPSLGRMAAEAGVNLEEAFGDAKPSPRPSEDKKP